MKRITYWAGMLAVTAVLGALCVLALTGCGHHHKHHRVYVLEQSRPGDEFIGPLEICWPDDWTDEQKAAAREGLLAHLNAWEEEFGLTAKPVKLILLSSYEPGSNLYEDDIILIYPGGCYEFAGLFSLLTHCGLDDPEELDSRWHHWKRHGHGIAKGIKKRCRKDHDDHDDEDDHDS